MPEFKRKRKLRSIVNAVYSSPWAILPEKLDEILTVIEDREAGLVSSQDEIAARIGSGTRPANQQTNGVALLNLYGTISQRIGLMESASGGTSCESFLRAFNAAVASPDVATIVINIDSPGGSVHGVREAAAAVYAARGKKRIVTQVSGQMASAACWIGCAADEVRISPSSMAGSIGVLLAHNDYTEADKKAGVNRTYVYAGKFKTEGAGTLSPEAIAARQEMVNTIYADFVGDVARFRDATAEAVRDGMGQGRMLLAQAAVRAGLADTVGTLDELLAELGVGSAAASSPRAAAPALDLKGFKAMNKEVFEALIRLGVCGLDDSANEFASAQLKLGAYLAGKGYLGAKAIDLADSAKVLAALNEKPAATVTGTEAAAAAAGGAHSPTSAQSAAAGSQTNVTATLQAVEPDRAEQIYAAIELAAFPEGFDTLAYGRELVGTKGLSSVEAFNKIRDKRAELSKPAGSARIEAGPQQRDKFVSLAENALLCRLWNGDNPDEVFDERKQAFVPWKPEAQNYGMNRMPKLAARCLIEAGFPAAKIDSLPDNVVCAIAIGGNPSDYGVFADSGASFNTTGMFSNIFLDATRKTLRRSYVEEDVTFDQWMKKAQPIPDFKEVHRIIAGELASPKAIPENGEFEETTLTDGREKYRLVVYGNRFSLTWQMLVNDDLGSFQEITTKQGAAMRRKQNQLAYRMLTQASGVGPTLRTTGGALFNSTAVTAGGTGHANLTTGSATPTTATLSAMKKKMRMQKGLSVNDSQTLGIMPRHILYPPALDATIMTLLTSMADPAGTNSGVANIVKGKLNPIEEPLLDASAYGLDTAWYLIADHRKVDTCEYAYLEGLESPRLEQQESFDRLAKAYRIYQCFAVAAIDYRGMQKHNGA